MLMRTVLWLLLILVVTSEDEFTFDGFNNTNLSLDGIASISDGLLRLTNATRQTKGQAFYPIPFQFREKSSGRTLSFSTSFVFAIVSEFSDISTFGFTFCIAPTERLSGDLGQYLGLLNLKNDGNSSNHIVAVEFDTTQNPEFSDIDDNHVGIDVNEMRSLNSHTAGYFSNGDGKFNNLSIISGDPMQVWVEYDSGNMRFNITLAPLSLSKPNLPLLSSTINLSKIILDTMYVGFTASEGNILTTYYILGWSFKINGEAQPLNLARLPSLPRKTYKAKSKTMVIWLPISMSILVLATILVITHLVMRKKKFAEILEDWEQEYGPQRFTYKDLYRATNGFKDEGLLGAGGFGRVYRGVLPTSKAEVAVKRISHESRQGVRQFIAEIVSLGQLRHRNLVRLQGYCRRKGELLLVYDFMPNGSLDKFLFNQAAFGLGWSQRFQIIKGVASGLLYLHEDWEKVVIHRDIKASNVLLDSEFNGRLGDFGLARLYDHGTNPQTTHIVGTIGYLAPELTKTGKATKNTDVFAFGTFLLEIACGKRPIEPQRQGDDILLVDWVLEKWQKGAILETSDPRMGSEYVVEEVELVLKLGLLCCHPLAGARPSMMQVMQFLDGDVPLPELSPANLSAEVWASLQDEGFDNYVMLYFSSEGTMSFISEGR
ncbi:L-type lectin-domain containing receptor kinase SIT2-like [Elaeis guineensis]|uniref:non-specific serine/threonine protein kinase n=1 Tax=Elaeis guineensis var. tenera TaxID=51953 RepID=A0A6I9S2S3_ELAGV|nr:L-type lectin-domain containing receptor kinase IV.1-like [Elaeis guineensis]